MFFSIRNQKRLFWVPWLAKGLTWCRKWSVEIKFLKNYVVHTCKLKNIYIYAHFLWTCATIFSHLTKRTHHAWMITTARQLQRRQTMNKNKFIAMHHDIKTSLTRCTTEQYENLKIFWDFCLFLCIQNIHFSRHKNNLPNFANLYETSAS
jgi:hypothetical protein